MSKEKLYHLPEGVRSVIINNIDDLVNSHSWGKRSCSSVKKAMEMDNEREARQKAKDMFCDMMGMVAEDMVERNNTFVFPRREFGFMYIGNVRRLSPHYPYVVRFDGFMPGGRVVLSNKIRQINRGRFYRFKLIRRRHARIMRLMENGHRYVDR